MYNLESKLISPGPSGPKTEPTKKRTQVHLRVRHARIRMNKLKSEYPNREM